MKNKLNPLAISAIALGGAAAAGVAAVYGITEFFVDVAVEKKPPKLYAGLVHNMSGEGLTDRRQSKLDKQAQAAQKMADTPMEDVTATSVDGLELKGRYYKCQNPKRIIICCHGWRSSAGVDFGLAMDFLHDSGCDVLYINQRAQNGSSGDHMGFGAMERYDCQTWVNWVNDNTENLPIYLYGVSMGSASVMMSAGLPMPKRLHGIIADCGFTSVDDICTHVGRNNLHMPFKLTRVMGGFLFDKKVGQGSYKASTFDALSHTDIPVLFIHGEDDTFVPVSMTYENYKVCSSPKRMFIVPGADHNGSYMTDPEGYQITLNQFWQDFD